MRIKRFDIEGKSLTPPPVEQVVKGANAFVVSIRPSFLRPAQSHHLQALTLSTAGHCVRRRFILKG